MYNQCTPCRAQYPTACMKYLSRPKRVFRKPNQGDKFFSLPRFSFLDAPESPRRKCEKTLTKKDSQISGKPSLGMCPFGKSRLLQSFRRNPNPNHMIRKYRPDQINKSYPRPRFKCSPLHLRAEPLLFTN
ncbi:hypothetical protein NPIL_215271 [Nephila pilipes]|uniref:Uncharacterized protein n=1 Tax=Nephila pilipes TaxID=299642 RepID=A0A8X6NZL7_NEPPI|nr:hypothetical protein NPIL_215271 [Nephila pilipes]